MTFMVASIDADGFTASARCTGEVVRLTLGGTADIRAVGPLADLMPRLHDEVRRVGVREVIVDLLEVEFMNSSCFKAFVAWIAQLQGLDASERYRVRLLSNPRMHWQRRSLHALSCFAADLVTVET
jgi:hypothetical protein